MTAPEPDRTGDEMTALADLLEAIAASPDAYRAAVDAAALVPEEEVRVRLAAALVLLWKLTGPRSAIAGRLIADTIRIRESWNAPDPDADR